MARGTPGTQHTGRSLFPVPWALARCGVTADVRGPCIVVRATWKTALPLGEPIAHSFKIYYESQHMLRRAPRTLSGVGSLYTKAFKAVKGACAPRAVGMLPGPVPQLLIASQTLIDGLD